jgi:hypothetical protein
MGMLSEAAHASTAQDLEKILMKAADEMNMKVIIFCRDNIYPLYKYERDDSYGLFKSVNEEKLKKIFE